MMTTLAKLSLVAVLTAAASPVQAAEQPQTTVALLPASGTNLYPGILQAADDLLKDHLWKTGKFKVISLSGKPGTVEPTPAQAAEQARAVGADTAIVLQITRLGNTARCRLAAYRVADAQLLYWDSMTAAGGPDDLDPVLARLAKGLATGKPSGETADLETVTEKEAEALNKRTATHTFGVRVGSLFAFNRAGGGTDSVPGLGIFWLYDARRWLADVAIDFNNSSGNGTDRGSDSFAVGIGAYYPFLRTDFTPYVGGVVKWGVTQFGGAGATGLTLQPTAGVMLGRLSTVQFRGEVGYFINTYSEDERGCIDYCPGPSISGAQHFSHGPTLSVGIGF